MYQDLSLAQLTDDLLRFEPFPDHRFAPLFYFASLTYELAQFLGVRSQVRGCLVSAGAVVAAGSSESKAMHKLNLELRSMLASYEFWQGIVLRRALVSNMGKPVTNINR